MVRSRVIGLGNGTALMLLCWLVLGGCSAQGTRFSALPALGQDEALIVVYRPSAFARSGTWPDIYVDGQKRGELKNGGYLFLRVPPAGHLVEVKGPVMRWDIRAEPLSCKPEVCAGETVFIRLLTTSDRYPLAVQITTALGLVNREVALRELSSLCESQ